jgi:murein L,D-transpeptidase YafK
VNKLLFAVSIMTALAWAANAQSEGWQAVLGDHPSLPSTFLAVDKDGQEFYVMGRRSPLQVIKKLDCTTGQVRGDKLKRGDLRTPEGVYFIESRRDRGLDYGLYGDRAFVLNYPNPVDRLKGKTGSGIWIHGRGNPIIPRETRGCVALNTPDLAALDLTDLQLGMPVTIARDLQWNEGPLNDSAAADALVDAVFGWGQAWQDKSDDFFGFYDASKFSKAQPQSFSAFKARKKRLFGKHDWIQVLVDEVRVVPGPDYWVTYFKQYYRTPTLATEGVKRLYWQRSDSGDYKIVGREWLGTDVGLEPAYAERVRTEVLASLETWRTSWENGDLLGYVAGYDKDIRQGKRWGTEAVREHKSALWQDAQPREVKFHDIHVDLHPEGARAVFKQQYAAENGYEDYGEKTLVLRPEGKTWSIVKEDWRALP